MAKPSVIGVLALAGGAVLAYSATTGKNVSAAIRNVLTGQSPAQATSANTLSSASPLDYNPSTTQGSFSGPIGSVAPSGPGETAWITAFLTSIGAPVTQANLNSIAGWIQHEGPYGTQGANNPLNTTIETTGATGKFAGTPVTNYDTPGNGIAAIVRTLMGSGAYSDILTALRSGKGLCGQTYSGLSTWSGGGYSQVC